MCGDDLGVLEGLQQFDEFPAGAGVRFFLIGPGSSELPPALPVTRLELEDPRLKRYPFIFHLGERSAYGFIGRQEGKHGGPGFHSSDQNLVELLIHKLLSAFELSLKF